MPFAVKIGAFDGPLDLLLSLIEERKLSISDVSLSKVTDEYFGYVQKMENYPMHEVSQFVLIAATLLLIKSRSLLPNIDLTDEEESDIKELEKRLRHYQIIRRGARILMKEWGVKPLRTPAQAPVRPTPRFAPGNLTLSQIVEAFRALTKALPTAAFIGSVSLTPTITLEEMIKKLEKRITQAVKMRFKEITKGAGKSEMVIQFLALLELIRGGTVSAKQDKTFSDIMLELDTVKTPQYGPLT
jgi:segregation and condensation protein A